MLGLQQQGTILAPQLVKTLDLELHDAEHGVFVFAVDDTTMSVPALFLLRFHHGASLEAHDAQAQLEQSLIQVVGFTGALPVVRLRVAHPGLQRVVPRSEDARPVQS